MRTKTLLLSALLGTLGSISAMAQANVYSANAVGYVTIDLKPGYNMIGDQLVATGGNTLSNLLDDTTGTYDSLAFYQWTGSSYNNQDFGDSCCSSGPNGWENGGLTVILNPGQATWVLNENPPGPGNDIYITFAGTVPGTNSVTVSSGYNQVTQPNPLAGDVVTNGGFTENMNDGDAFFVWNPSLQSYSAGSYNGVYYVDFENGSYGFNTDFDNPAGDPTTAIGQGFWYLAASPITFKQSFSVSQ